MHRLLHSVLFSFFSLLFSLSITFAQNTKPVAQQVQYLHSEGFTFETFSPFKPAFKPSPEIQQALREVQMLELDEAVLSDIMSRRPDYVTLEIPYKGETMRIDLYQHNILGNQFAVLTGDNERQFYSPGLYYRGVLADDPNTICSFSFFEKEIMGFVSTAYTGNLVIGRVETPGNRTRYVFYDDKDLQAPRSFECAAREIEGQAPVKLDHDVTPELINGCIEMFLEVDFALYTNKGSMANTVNYMTGLFNQMATLYSNEQIGIRVAQLYVWTAQDPYPINDSFSALSTFQTQRVNWVGDLAHLVALGGQNIGGVAWVNAICSSANGYAYSNIWASYSSVPTYSWSVEVLTHETGHNMGSNHTHWCGWTGGALDNCYTTEGGCAAGPAPTNGGTIMSYCHLASYGINFSNGFGTQPGDVIRARVTSAYNNGNGCITASCTPPTCAAPANISVSSVTTTTATVTWTTVSGATGYNLQYRPQNGSTWTTVNNATNPYTISGLTANTLYEAQVQTVCSGGNSTYQNAVIFKSGDLPCTVPSSLTAGSITTTSAALNWTDTNSGPTWEVQYGPRGFTLGSGTTITTSTKPYTVSGLSHSRNYEFYVRALCSGGTGNSVWSSVGSFTTTLSNNQASGAVALTVGGSCPGNGAYSNIGSNTSTNEFSPTVANGGYWDTGISNTVWFSFVAPSSGSVKITTDIALTGSGKLDDTQIALYSTTNVNDYSLFRHLVSNEDGSTNNSGISTQVFYSGLTPGVTYYIQVDGWNTGTGAFCITVSETIDIATPTTSCQSYTATVNGS
ncbi:MAG: fibronectin type III domain-containing protein, partial [Saprospiraceae bacterium]|nr:fibronectin type III domain-containing protein [Saprospiraceae bacterium]